LCTVLILFMCFDYPFCYYHSVPTRRSSDLYGLIGMKKNWDVFSDIVYSREDVLEKILQKAESLGLEWSLLETLRDIDTLEDLVSDRKSTRLNSSHVSISYAVFCLKKKTTQY